MMPELKLFADDSRADYLQLGSPKLSILAHAFPITVVVVVVAIAIAIFCRIFTYYPKALSG